MNELDQNCHEIFAYYGKAMFFAQTIEKGLILLIISCEHKFILSKTRYDEILFEKAALTLGQLKREIVGLNIFTDEELIKLDIFHNKRDILAHSYWWDNAVELFLIDTQKKLLFDLKETTIFFEELNEIIENKLQLFIKKNEIDFDLENIMHEMVELGETIPIEKFRKLSKNETILDLFQYKNTSTSIIPIFKLQDESFWTLCEVGLSQYKFEIVESNKILLDILSDIFPINQFNPRPKINTKWNYILDLKVNGLKMFVNKENDKSPMRWGIKTS